MPLFKSKASKSANRGINTQEVIGGILERISSRNADFDYLRLPDARAAGGRLSAMPADYEFFAPGVHGLIEVKEVKHDYRVPRKNVPQFGKMLKRELAGGKCFLVIYHSTINKWRMVRVDKLSKDDPSWDLRSVTAWGDPEQMVNVFL